MRKILLSALAMVALAQPALAETTPAAAPALPHIGAMAPALVAKDIAGQDVDLAKLQGKIVVLEWTNHECPFVKKHYDPKNMQALQKELTDKGVVWISVVSSAKDKQGHVTPEKAASIVTEQGATVTHKILDESGAIGRAYGAKTTPHMFVIDTAGKVAYMGAIDSDSSFKDDAIKNATNYVRVAVDEILAGKPVTTAQTEPYGCSVKY